MFQIDNSTAVTTMPAPDPAGTPGFFTGGSPGAGTPATILPADWLNAVQAEMVSILAAAGISPSKTANNQVLLSLRALFASLSGSNTQTFNVAAATTTNQAVNFGQFGNSVSTSGYQKLPSGLIIQWGQSTYTGASDTQQTRGFPIAFPNGAYCVVGSVQALLGDTTMGFQVQNTSGLLVGMHSASGTAASGTAFTWIAIGS